MPDRDLASIPGLKDWLVDHYRDEYGNWDGDYSVIFADNVPDEGPFDFMEIMKEKPGWIHIPYVLARTRQGDPDVHDALLGSTRLYRGLTLVSLLNQGQFTSNEADKVRWDVLAAADGNRDMVLAPSMGLAMSGDTGAIPYLLDVGENHAITRHAVIKSLGSYGTADLVSHLERIKGLVEESEKGLHGVPTSAGFFKLRSLVESVGDQ